MTFYLNQQFKLRETIGNLQAKMQSQVLNMDAVEEIDEISKQYELLIREIGNLCEETAKAINGETRPENFTEQIRGILEDEHKTKANEISEKITKIILGPIREALKKTSSGNLVPDVQEPAQPASFSFSAINNMATNGAGDDHGPFNREFIMREIENPTPAEVSTAKIHSEPKNPGVQNNSAPVQNEKIVTPPINLPIEKVTVPENLKEAPILRTMSRDVMTEQKNPSSGENRASSWPVNRGKFGHGTPPTLKNPALIEQTFPPKILPTESTIPKQTPSINNQEKPAPIAEPQRTTFIPIRPGVMGGTLSGSNIKPSPIPNFIPKPPEKPPIPVNQIAPTPQSTPNPVPPPQSKAPEISPRINIPNPSRPPLQPRIIPPIQQTNSVKNVVEDKLTKTVNIPSERKKYVVDPYREPLD